MEDYYLQDVTRNEPCEATDHIVLSVKKSFGSNRVSTMSKLTKVMNVCEDILSQRGLFRPYFPQDRF
ncbi:hypothetical protein ABKN59_001780 [Abortiporus biennis]